THGTPTHWHTTPTTPPPNLPTYPFQHHRYWLEDAATDGDPESLGLRTTDHPLLSAATTLAHGDTLLLTGRIAARAHPWLTHRALHGTVPLELALQSGRLLGGLAVARLTPGEPLALPPAGGLDVQFTVSAPEADGERAFQLFARPYQDAADAADTSEDGSLHRPWTALASGRLTTAPTAPLPRIPDAQPHATVALPEEITEEAGRYGLHPALLDLALEAAIGAIDEDMAPAVWGGVMLHAVGAQALRVFVTQEATGYSLRLTDGTGALVASVDSLELRPLERATAGARHDWLLSLHWPTLDTDTSTSVDPLPPWALIEGTAATEATAGIEGTAGVEGVDAPGLTSVLGSAPVAPAESPSLVILAADHAEGLLVELQQQLSAAVADRLVVLTRHAVVTEADDPTRAPEPGPASVWGLVRAAQAENPGHITLVDLDEEPASLPNLPRALASGEPELAIRGGVLHVPRLKRSSPEALTETERSTPVAQGTVVISGDGDLAEAAARHFIDAAGAKALLVIGEDTAWTGPYLDRGVQVDVYPGTASDREALAAALTRLPADLPPTDIVHVPGPSAEAVLLSTDPEAFADALRTETRAAWNLHELTLDQDLASFTLLARSPSGVLGGTGHAAEASLGARLDALAHHRRTLGLHGTSIAWGPREAVTDPASHGLAPFRADQIDALLTLALDRPPGQHPARIAARLDRVALRERAGAGLVPAVLRDLVRIERNASVGPSAAAGSFASTVAELTESEQLRTLLDLVTRQIAGVLGHHPGSTVDASRAFKDLGFDSLTAVELRNRLATATGLRLPSTLIFDHPSPGVLASWLRTELLGSTAEARDPGAASGDDGEPIAIVSMACRFPGGVRSPEDLWRIVESEGDAISPFPTNRGWDLEQLFNDDPDHAGTSYAREGGFLHDADQFDPAFFGISPREATSMDPQHRLLLETAWEAFERAGIDPTSLQGSRTGVFAGVVYTDYGARVKLPADMEGYLGIGSAGSIASGRIAYTLGLEGPAVTVDTACSSSLVALHLAVRSLRSGECDLALAGGATVLANPDIFVGFSRQRGLAENARCKAFAAGADGTAFGEGVGLLLVERLSDARRHGHQVLALVRGTATNQDGASNGITAPNGPSQQRVIRQALADAGLETVDVDAMEAHGTGTTLGDPIEAQAIVATYGQDRPVDRPLYLGSLKSNIGHTQAAAGVGGIIKMVEAMRHGVLPRTLHIDEPSPHVDWSAGAVELLTEARAWQRNGRPRRAGVSGFGMSGTNAHVVLEEAPVAESGPEEPVGVVGGESLDPWLLSAHSDTALKDQATQLATYLNTHPHTHPNTIAHTLATGRSHQHHRAVITHTNTTTLNQALTALTQQTEHPNLTQATTTTPGKTVFVFPGQGSQWDGMARDLLNTSPTFTQHLTEVSNAIETHTGWNLLTLLTQPHPNHPPLDRVDIIQPALFAVMTSLAKLWQHHGIHPDAVIGHSQGEIAAAYIAGALTLQDATQIITLRSQTIHNHTKNGAMAHIPLDPTTTTTHLTPYNDLHIAAHNGPHSTIIAGNPQQLHQLTTHLNQNNIQTRTINVNYASHTPHVHTLKQQLHQQLHNIKPHPTPITFYSTLTTNPIDTTTLTADYWYQNLANPVLFHPTIQKLHQTGHTTYIETSPHPTLTTAIHDTLTTTDTKTDTDTDTGTGTGTGT
ncbi:type I polyketide synthase, partial [Streptomyces sp. NPDC005963]|uniref:type I polyketide synthase n=1 Tax=Streptomyces sp. NPDC005963 TaxID=3156721 RepID=UPI0033E2C2F7